MQFSAMYSPTYGISQLVAWIDGFEVVVVAVLRCSVFEILLLLDALPARPETDLPGPRLPLLRMLEALRRGILQLR